MTEDEKTNMQAEVENKILIMAGVAPRHCRVRKQRKDHNSLDSFKSVIKKRKGPSEFLNDIQDILMKTGTLGSIVNNSMFIKHIVSQELQFLFSISVFCTIQASQRHR